MKTNTNQEFSVANAGSAVYTQLVTVGVLKNAGSNLTDIVTATTGSVFVAQSPETFTHDADGNLTNDGRWAYSWDAENRLIGTETVAGLPAEIPRQKLVFGYDAQSRRISKVVSNWTGSAWVEGTNLRFVYDVWNLIAELDATNGLVRSYTWGLDLSGSPQGAGGIGGLLAATFGTNGTHFVAFDGNGNVGALVSASTGAESARYEYGPFGETVRATGAAAGFNVFRFSTKYEDAETRLLYYGYRYYQPSSGRWPSRDPMEEDGGVNVFAYVQNAPVNLSDPKGLVIFEIMPRVPAGARWSWANLGNQIGGVTVVTYFEIKCCPKCCDPIAKPDSKYRITCKVTVRLHIYINQEDNPIAHDVPFPKIYGHEQQHIKSLNIEIPTKLGAQLQHNEDLNKCKFTWAFTQAQAKAWSAKNFQEAEAKYQVVKTIIGGELTHSNPNSPPDGKGVNPTGGVPSSPKGPLPDPEPTKCEDLQ